MAAVLSDHQPIRAVQTISGQSPQELAKTEKAGQTFLEGVPVMTVVSGNLTVVQEWNATVTEPATNAAGIAGISRGPGSNLATDGKGAPQGSGTAAFIPVGPPAAAPTFGSVLNQSAAVNFTPGAPFVDGRQYFEVANQDTIFEATFDSADGSTANATTNFNMEGKHFGLTKDTTGHWYVDAQKVTQGTNTVVVIVKLNPMDGNLQNGRVWFRFESGIQQYGN